MLLVLLLPSRENHSGASDLHTIWQRFFMPLLMQTLQFCVALGPELRPVARVWAFGR